jgi:hypothetical protein
MTDVLLHRCAFFQLETSPLPKWTPKPLPLNVDLRGLESSGSSTLPSLDVHHTAHAHGRPRLGARGQLGIGPFMVCPVYCGQRPGVLKLLGLVGQNIILSGGPRAERVSIY